MLFISLILSTLRLLSPCSELCALPKMLLFAFFDLVLISFSDSLSIVNKDVFDLHSRFGFFTSLLDI